MRKPFNEQYVAIAGGFRGMGFELAKLILSDGANVFLIGRNPENGEKALESLRKYGGRVEVFSGDISKDDVLNEAKAQAEKWCKGRLNHLAIFLGSGKTPFGHDFPTDHWKGVFEVNFFAPIAVARTFFPLMVHGEGKPSITFTGAIAGMERLRAPMTYSIAKTALIAYVNYFADHVVDTGVRVNIVSPGNVFYKGGRWEEILEERGDEIKDFIKTSVGMKRLGTAEELAEVFYSIMSPANSFMTGQNIVADGLQTRRFL